VRVGEPLNVRGLSDYVQAPVYSTAVGLLQYGRMHQNSGPSKEYNTAKASVGGLVKRVSNWLRGEF
jgi:cell division protein FtsA